LKGIENPKTESDWLTTDEAQVQMFLEDPLCGFSLTLNGFKGMEELIRGLYDREKIARIDKEFPMYFIFGEKDPVGDFGKTAYKSYKMYSDAGMKRVSNKAYPGKRHELLHEDIREKVMQDVIEWIGKVIK
jgi:alpha-beta hydrolase superfamily lysophospholipase